MKLRNKKTGQVKEFEIGKLEEIFTLKDGREIADYKYFYSLAELNEEWEDSEEPETYYYVSDLGNIESLTNDHGHNLPEEICHKAIERRKQIGNYFETKEEAEKAVEKLKAWKRLKDKGFERVFRLELGDAICGGKTATFKLIIDNNDTIEDIKSIMVDRKQWKKLLNRVKYLERDNENLKKRVKNINKRLRVRR